MCIRDRDRATDEPVAQGQAYIHCFCRTFNQMIVDIRNPPDQWGQIQTFRFSGNRMRWLRSNGIITFFGRTLLTLHSIMTVPCLTFFCLITLGIFPVFFIRSSPLVFSYSVIIYIGNGIVHSLCRQLSRHCRDYFPDTVWTFVRSRIFPTFSPIRSSSSSRDSSRSQKSPSSSTQIATHVHRSGFQAPDLCLDMFVKCDDGSLDDDCIFTVTGEIRLGMKYS